MQHKEILEKADICFIKIWMTQSIIYKFKNKLLTLDRNAESDHAISIMP